MPGPDYAGEHKIFANGDAITARVLNSSGAGGSALADSRRAVLHATGATPAAGSIARAGIVGAVLDAKRVADIGFADVVGSGQNNSVAASSLHRRQTQQVYRTPGRRRFVDVF
jgi:hypothetical protein